MEDKRRSLDEVRAGYALEAIARLRRCIETRARRELVGKSLKRALRAEHAEGHCLFRLVVGRVPNDDERAALDEMRGG